MRTSDKFFGWVDAGGLENAGMTDEIRREGRNRFAWLLGSEKS